VKESLKAFLVLVGFLIAPGCQHSGFRHTVGDRPFSKIHPAALTDRPAATADHVLTLRRTIEAPRGTVWAVLADYGNVHVLSPSIRDSHHVSGPEQGVGAVRECKVAMGMTVTEDVEVWELEESMVINMHSAMPVRNHKAEFSLSDHGPNRTEVAFVMRYDTKAGIMGTAMNAAMIEKMMRKSMVELMDGLQSKATAGYAPQGMPHARAVNEL